MDPIAFDRDLLENAEYWISTEILERIKTNFRGLEDQIAKRIEPAYVKVLQEAFRVSFVIYFEILFSHNSTYFNM